jgi:hypothetical protein
MKLNSFQQSIRSLYRNFKKGKYYAIFRVFWDSEYRGQIQYMRRLTRQHDLILSHGAVPLNSMTPGHSINYPKWVDHLVNQINTVGWKKMEPIKVIWDESQTKWLVVDGNHRLEALRRTLPKYMKIPVFILRRSDVTIEEYQDDIYSRVAKDMLTSNVQVSNMTRAQAASIVLGAPYKRENRNG